MQYIHVQVYPIIQLMETSVHHNPGSVPYSPTQAIPYYGDTVFSKPFRFLGMVHILYYINIYYIYNAMCEYGSLVLYTLWPPIIVLVQNPLQCHVIVT